MTGKEKFDKVMHEWGQGTLESHDSLVTDRNQAIAIAFSEARKVEPDFGSNPVSLEQVKDVVNFAKGSPDKYISSGDISQELIDEIVIKHNQGKSPEEIWLELEQLNPKTMPKKLSKLEKASLEKDLKDIQSLLHKAIMSQNFEKAANLRQEERDIMSKLNIEIEKKQIKRRSFEDIEAKGNKGLIILEAQRAFALAKQDNFKGLNIDEKNANGILFALTKEGGIIDNIPEDSSEFESLVKLGILIKEDISNSILTEPVRYFIMRLVSMVKSKSKLKTIASKKSIPEQMEEEEKAKAQLDVEGAFIENRDKFIALNHKAYGNLAIAEIKDFGQKMPFGHLRPVGDTHLFYLSEKLVSLLDKHKIHYTELENKDELIEYIEKL